MAQLPADFRVQPREDIDPHTLGEQPGTFDAPPREEWPSYAQGPDRWDIANNPPARQQGEPYRMWLSKLYANAMYWHNQDEAAAPTSKAAGRPRVHPTIPGETDAERTRRVNREAQARWRKAKTAGMSEARHAAHERWQALRQQANELQIEIAKARAEYLATP